MAYPVPAPPRPAGSPFPSSERLATCWRNATSMRFRSSRSGPRGSASPPSYGSKKPAVTRSPQTQTWSTWSVRPTTAKRTQSQEVQEHGAGCATAPPPTQTVVTWCAVAGATTHTTTRASGSATASSTGAALSSATPAARNQRFTPASRDGWSRGVCAEDGQWLKTRGLW